MCVSVFVNICAIGEKKGRFHDLIRLVVNYSKQVRLHIGLGHFYSNFRYNFIPRIKHLELIDTPLRLKHVDIHSDVHSVNSPHSLRNHSALTPHSLHTHSALTSHSFRTHFSLIPLSLRTNSALTPHSLRTHSALIPH